ncbi:MAG: phospho-sugar mutase [Clostridiaceae bacterium]
MDFKLKYEEWLGSSFIDEATKQELKEIKDEKEIEERFYKDLEFGTGGLRGIIGAGSNRMNIYTVGMATQGFADYINSKFSDDKAIAIAYDSRNMSKEFAEITARVMCGNGIKVYLFESLRATPQLSFAVRELKCKGGVVITASHNPSKYNGYKAYGPDGGQLTDNDATAVIDYVSKVGKLENTKTISLEDAKEKGLLVIIGEDIDKAYIEAVKSATIRKELVNKSAKDLKIIFTPIHGAGNIPVRRVLTELGYEQLHVVKQQEEPNGNFPTAPYPNPEAPEVFKLALDMAKEIGPDIIFGTDPDCDRIGAVVKDSQGEYKILTGNQTGVLLTHYIISSLKDEGKLASNGVVIKTIVTSEMATRICEDYGVEIIDVLTGFKYIGEIMTKYEKSKGKEFLFGFEESYGCLVGDHARDKDAVVAAALICEMTLYYKNKGLSLYDAFMELNKKYGFYKEKLVSIELQGKEGQEKIQKALEYLRENPITEVDGVAVSKALDYKASVEKDLKKDVVKEIHLPKSNVLKYILEDGAWLVVRPSGTEPKMKVYMAVVGKDLNDGEEKAEKFSKTIMEIIDKACNS